jgi:uncharacterized protein YbjT (DUF2867 family)
VTVLVTGGTGFVGPKVVHALRAEERPVRVLARHPDKQERFRAWGCEVVQGDMTDAASLGRAAEGAEAVVHLVGLAPFADPDTTKRVMEQGTRDLVGAAEKAGVRRFLLMSALGINERSKDLSAYSHAKWDEEQAVKESGLEHTILRPSFIFGRDGGMLPVLIRLNRFSPVVPVAGTKRFQPIWVEDVAAYFAAGLSSPAAAGETFEVGGPDVVTFAEVHDRIRKTLGKRRLAFQMPTGLLKVGASAGRVVPRFRGAPGAIAMLEFEDNVTDIKPAVQTLGIEPISLDDQLRRATAGA